MLLKMLEQGLNVCQVNHEQIHEPQLSNVWSFGERYYVGILNSKLECEILNISFGVHVGPWRHNYIIVD